jgi:hypothetical protein
VRIHFGKFKGHDLAELPKSYLDWLTTIELWEPLRSGVERESRRRDNPAEFHEQVGVSTLDAGKVQKVYRALAFQYHPDRIGGNGDVMKGVNLFYEAISNI